MRGSQVRFLPGSPRRIGLSGSLHFLLNSYRNSGSAPTLNSPSAKSNRGFAVVMVFSFVLGMAVALAVYLLWRSRAGNLQTWPAAIPLVVCPPFILSYVICAMPDSVFVLL